MKQFDQAFLEEQKKAQRATIFRIYDYYRILISFLFLFLFLDPNLNDFVGKVDPGLFKITIVSYIIINVVLGIATPFANVNFLSRSKRRSIKHPDQRYRKMRSRWIPIWKILKRASSLMPLKQLDGIKQQRPGSWVLPSARYATS